MSRHYVGIEDANNMLPTLRSQFVLLFQLHLHVKNLISELEFAGCAPQTDTFQVMIEDANEQSLLARGQLRAAIDCMRDELDVLREAGCIIQDIEDGGVAWYAQHPERGDIMLSWRLGESEVAHWFEVGTGDRTRRPIAELNGPPRYDAPDKTDVDSSS